MLFKSHNPVHYNLTSILISKKWFYITWPWQIWLKLCLNVCISILFKCVCYKYELLPYADCWNIKPFTIFDRDMFIILEHTQLFWIQLFQEMILLSVDRPQLIASLILISYFYAFLIVMLFLCAIVLLYIL